MSSTSDVLYSNTSMLSLEAVKETMDEVSQAKSLEVQEGTKKGWREMRPG